MPLPILGAQQSALCKQGMGVWEARWRTLGEHIWNTWNVLSSEIISFFHSANLQYAYFLANWMCCFFIWSVRSGFLAAVRDGKWSFSAGGVGWYEVQRLVTAGDVEDSWLPPSSEVWLLLWKSSSSFHLLAYDNSRMMSGTRSWAAARTFTMGDFVCKVRSHMVLIGDVILTPLNSTFQAWQLNSSKITL